MQIIEVKTASHEKEFMQVPHIIYHNDPNWIPHLDNDIRAVFDPKKNNSFESGILCRWVLKDDGGNLAGRIAAFINREIAYTYKNPLGGIGFFECINNQEAAFLLFETAKKWLGERGIEAMEGPVNFGEKDRYWGLMVDGNENPPPYLLNYNPSWYKDLFETYGFRNYYEQFVYRLRTDIQVHPVIERSFHRLTNTGGYRFEKVNRKKVHKQAEDFRDIYNEAWKDVHAHFKPLNKQQVLNIFKSLKNVFDENLVVFAYHHEKPIAIFWGIPELNCIFRHLNGRLNLLGKLKFLYYKWKGECTTVYGIVFGVVPEYRNKGIESGLILTLQNNIRSQNIYKDMYISWIGDFNHKMIKIVETLTREKAFTLVTYRMFFSGDVAFNRHPVID